MCFLSNLAGICDKSAWNPKANHVFNGCLVISNHFPCKDLVHHPIETTIKKWMFRVPGVGTWITS